MHPGDTTSDSPTSRLYTQFQGECQFFKSARDARFFRGNHAPDVCRINGKELQSGRLVEQVAVRGEFRNQPDATFELNLMMGLIIFEDKDHAVIANSQSVSNDYHYAHFQVILRFLCYLRPLRLSEERSQTTKYRALKKASLSQFWLPNTLEAANTPPEPYNNTT